MTVPDIAPQKNVGPGTVIPELWEAVQGGSQGQGQPGQLSKTPS